jgi:glucose/arabinose dehydrogenase
MTTATKATAEPKLPSGFQDAIVPFEGLKPGEGLQEPAAVRFAPGGKVFVAEKSGKILVYDSLADKTPTLFADLRTEVYNANDRGLLGIALDPQFSVAHPYVYVLYAYDAPPGEEAPFWGNEEEDGDECPDPPGANTDGCVIQGRLSRLTANLGTDKSVHEEPMITDWCQQFSSHSVGDLQFDSEGNLWASGGEGASFESADFGQYGAPLNPCGDPPEGIGGIETPPTAEGGSLRAQNRKTLNGSLIRVDPETGAGVVQNPLAASLNANERRLVAKGFRNPFRFAIDPTTGEIYVDNVGSSGYEEIDRFSPSSSTIYNSGWPCYEGPQRRAAFEALNLNVCNALYANPGSTSQPFFYYSHLAGVTPEDPCPYEPGSAISGLAFYEGGSYPAKYEGALFFADAVRGCVYVMTTGEDGRPDPSTAEPFLTEGGLYPGVDIEVGPGGDLYYVSLTSEQGPGAIHQISYDPKAPQARLKPEGPTWGSTPLLVKFDAGESSDPQEEETLEYEWDLDGNGKFTAPTPDSAETETYEDPSENKTAAVRVVDELGHESVAQVTVYPGDTPPVPEIEAPVETLKWSVGQPIKFAGLGFDPDEAVEEIPEDEVPAARLYWRSQLFHCPGGPKSCHGHPLQVFPAVKSGILIAPDHGLPSHIDLSLTATDARGLSVSKTVSVYPDVANLSIRSDPPGVSLTAGEQTAVAPFSFSVIEGSKPTIAAPERASLDGTTYVWTGWSDGGARIHTIVAEGSTPYTAEYAAQRGPVSVPETRLDVPPRTRLTKHPKKAAKASIATFRFSAGTGAHFICKLDRKPFRPCRSPRIYRHLKSGRHVFRVIAIDANGNADLTPAIFSWKVFAG